MKGAVPLTCVLCYHSSVLDRRASELTCFICHQRPRGSTLCEGSSWSASLPRLVIVSNRVSVPDAAGKGTAGGLAVALREAFQAYQGLWFGWSGKVAAHPTSQPRMVDRGNVQYALMDLTSLDRQEYYNGFANRALWPTMHYRVGLSDFSRTDYAGYLRVNRAFATALAKLVCPSDLVWVHDYHLIPLAAELRPLGLTNLIGYFHHIPWPAPEVLGTLPGSTDLLRAIMDFNLVGVQTERDADNLRRATYAGTRCRSSKGGCTGRRRKEHLREKLSDRHRRERLSASSPRVLAQIALSVRRSPALAPVN